MSEGSRALRLELWVSTLMIQDKARRLSYFNNSVWALEQEQDEMLVLPKAQLGSVRTSPTRDLTPTETQGKTSQTSPFLYPFYFQILQKRIRTSHLCGFTDDGMHPLRASINQREARRVCRLSDVNQGKNCGSQMD